MAASVSPTPETPERSWGPDPSWAAWKRAGFCPPLSGLSQLLPRSSDKGVRGRGLQTPKAPAKRAGLQCSGHPAPSGYSRGNPARPPPSTHGPCTAAGPGRAPRTDSAGYTWCRRTGPRPPSCSSVSSSTAARSEAGPYGELGRRRPDRGLLLLPPPSFAPTRASPREPKSLWTPPSPSASTSAPAPPETPSQQLLLSPVERRRETKRVVRCSLAERQRIHFLLGLPSPFLISWGSYCVTWPLLPTPNPDYAGSSHKGRKSLANSSPTLKARESRFKLAPPEGRAVGICNSQSQVWVRAPNPIGQVFAKVYSRPQLFFPGLVLDQIIKLLLILFVIGQKVSTSPGEASRSQASAFLGVQSKRTDGEFELLTRFNLCQSFYSIISGDKTTPCLRFLVEKAPLQ